MSFLYTEKYGHKRSTLVAELKMMACLLFHDM